MSYYVNKVENKVTYLVMYHDELVMEASTIEEIPLVIKDLLDLGDHYPEDLAFMKIIEQRELDLCLVPKCAYEVNLKVKP